jgi:hypothetical protein
LLLLPRIKPHPIFAITGSAYSEDFSILGNCEDSLDPIQRQLWTTILRPRTGCLNLVRLGRERGCRKPYGLPRAFPLALLALAELLTHKRNPGVRGSSLKTECLLSAVSRWNVMLLLLLLRPVVRSHMIIWVLQPLGRRCRHHAWQKTVLYPGVVPHLSRRLLPCRCPCPWCRQPVDDGRLLPHGRCLPSLSVRLNVCGRNDRRRRGCLAWLDRPGGRGGHHCCWSC